MAVETSLPALLSSLQTSLTSALSSAPDSSPILPPKDGISLLDTKNELLLSYLQNLVFLIILKIRDIPSQTNGATNGADDQASFRDNAVKKLVELRVFLERGVRPLEGRLKYQIDKVLRAADDATRTAAQNTRDIAPAKASINGAAGEGSGDENSDAEADNDAEGGRSGNAGSDIDELSYRPNPLSFVRSQAAAATRPSAASADGIYRPPRITPTALPTTIGKEERAQRKPGRSATLDEFVNTELSTAPMAEPSIGSTIIEGGRRTKSQKERQDDAERLAYEEANYVRLPKISKKERAKKGRDNRQGGFGGEEWRSLGDGLDRIDRLTRKSKGTSGALERSRKRGLDDGPSGGSANFGERFDKRRKTHERKRRV
ncbi:hypothetical protein L228DRAFT_243976 [Xylona heveae TC161]|uniref:Localizes primarily to the nucleolus n=1 Tax=Xylona heveae (strain CBS 132557 / TC161) TaxID=1328760 RepID=A0A165IP68_XYLHT|nr:hypothetical protein L228DRAFT_243976 [Xylona heveae TC161]KZF25182.1 hypothetical protein L228DRAFT_243976 [Xylona heveae TC161]